MNHEIFSVGGGRYARIFVGLAPGWVADRGATVSAEDIAHHLGAIRDPQGYVIPENITDELRILSKVLKA